MLPQMPYTKNKYKSTMVPMLGLNLSNNFTDGELIESKNVSSRAYPFLTIRKARAKQSRGGAYYTGASAMAATNKLVVAESSTQGGVNGYQLYYDGSSVTNGFVTTKPKQFVAINTNIVVWPNKMYIDLSSTPILRPMEATATCTGIFFTDEYTFRTTTDLSLFKANDSVSIVGTGAGAGKETSIVIDTITTSTIEGTYYYIVTTTATAFAEWVNESFPATINRSVPNMAYICQNENRLFGCTESGDHIYVSGLGLPCTWNDFRGLSTDSYVVDVATPGGFTGCIALGGNVLFFKEKNLHKLTGSYPAEYYLYQYEFEGLRQGCEKSMTIINEVLYYVGLHGVYAYSGSTPTLLSSKLGEVNITNAVGGNDGDTYYISALFDGTRKMMAYETRYGLWQHEDDLNVVDFARIGRDLYFLDTSGFVWVEDNNTIDNTIEWYAQFTPFTESIQGRKTYSKVIMRLNINKGAFAIVKVRFDNNKWMTVKTITDQSGAVSVTVPSNRCDKFDIRIEGKGMCVVEQIMRQYTFGSER